MVFRKIKMTYCSISLSLSLQNCTSTRATKYFIIEHHAAKIQLNPYLGKCKLHIFRRDCYFFLVVDKHYYLQNWSLDFRIHLHQILSMEKMKSQWWVAAADNGGELWRTTVEMLDFGWQGVYKISLLSCFSLFCLFGNKKKRTSHDL